MRRWLREACLRGLLAALRGLADMLPASVMASLGVRFGRAWFRLGAPRVDRAKEQLAEAFPEWSGGERDETALRVFEHLGESLAEAILLGSRHRPALLARVDIEGLEHLQAARDSSPAGGVLLVTGHCGNWELAGIRLAEEGIALSAVERGFDSDVMTSTLREIRSGPAEARNPDYAFLKMGSAGLGFARALAEGRSVLVLLDQNARREEGVFVSFLGRPASVRPGPLRIAVRRGVPIVPIFTRRLIPGGRHVIEIGPAIELDLAEPADDPAREARNLARLTGTIERAIRRAPEQWIWPHRRWRTQPDSADVSHGA